MTDDERRELEQLREERWQVVAMRNGALNRAEAAEAKLAKVQGLIDEWAGLNGWPSVVAVPGLRAILAER